MPKMRLIIPRWRYAKTPLKQGDIFDVKEIHADLLPRMNIAELMDAQASKDKTAPPKAKAAAPRSAGKNPAPKAKPDQKNLTEMTVRELHQAAKAIGVTIDSNARKADIVNLLRRHRYGRRDMRAAN